MGFLLIHLLERMGFLIATAFVFSQSKWMRKYMDYPANARYQWRFVVFFSFFAILGTYTGVTVSELSFHAEPWAGRISEKAAIANSRTIGVVIAGLLGGVKSGFIVGLIAGIHRYSLGGFVALACMIAPVLQGILAGLMKKALQKRDRRFSSVHLSFAIGFAVESLQMGLILLLAKPFEQAVSLVSLIAVPQILANSIGVGLFFILYIQIKNEEQRVSAQRAIKALRIADMTLPQWAKPLHEAAKGVAEILVQETKAVGALFEKEGKTVVLVGKHTSHALDLPVGTEKKAVGIFRMFYEREEELLEAKSVALVGLTQLFSQQYAFVKTEKQVQLLADAEIRALQAQMNPHFLFNVLNTVKSFIRTRPDEARRMITQLAKFLRHRMQSGNRPLIPIKEELENVEAYLNLAQARMGDRLSVEKDIDERLLGHLLPPFSIQPLVENAVEHGLKIIGEGGKIAISVQKDGDRVVISVSDNGMWVERKNHEDTENHMGLALSNLEQRLQYHFGIENRLCIDKGNGEGTKVSFWVR